jgi:hypothetical protein
MGVMAMDAVEREAQVRALVEEVWNKRNCPAVASLHAHGYVNFRSGPDRRPGSPQRALGTAIR